MIIDEISKAIYKSKAKVIYVCNLVNKEGHTEKFKLDDYVDSINHFFEKPRINAVIYNDKNPTEKLREKYKLKKETPVFLTKKTGKIENTRFMWLMF